MEPCEAVYLSGGYGLVGQQVAELIRQRHPSLPLLIAGRSLEKAQALARRLAPAQAMAPTQSGVVEAGRPAHLTALRPRAVVSMANDLDHALLLEAARGGIPYLDITRWTEQVRAARAALGGVELRAPVMLSSAWMAGVPALAAVALARQMQAVERIDISILYSLKDKAGPNSVAYMDRLATPFEVTAAGQTKMVLPLTDPLRVRFPGGRAARAYRIDTPEQATLPAFTGAKSVSARIAFDDALTTTLLVFLARSGIWKLLSGPRFTALRRSLLYNPGPGAPHEIVVEVAGTDAGGGGGAGVGAGKTGGAGGWGGDGGTGGGECLLRAEISDPLGQSHLTAAGAVVQLERLLGLEACPPRPPPSATLTLPQICPPRSRPCAAWALRCGWEEDSHGPHLPALLMDQA